MITSLNRPIIYWQYKGKTKFNQLLNAFIDYIFEAYPCEWWEILDIDKAYGYALDLIGQRIGFQRPKDDPTSAGLYDISEYENSYYDYDPSTVDLVKDDVYRYMLKLRIKLYQVWQISTIETYYNALRYAYPNKSFRIYERPNSNVIELHALSFMDIAERRSLFSAALLAPMGRSLLVTYDYQ